MAQKPTTPTNPAPGVDQASQEIAADRRAAEEARVGAAADREAAEALLAQATTERAAADRARRRPSASPSSAQLEPVVVPRPALADTVIEERVAVRSAGYDVNPALDPTAPLFPARARVLPGGQVVQAVTPERMSAPKAEIPILSRTLHDGVLYEAGTTAMMTRAQFDALRTAGATEGFFPD